MAISSAPAFTPTRQQPCPRMRPRGVYLNDTLWNGQAIVVAVDSRANVVRWEPWTDDLERVMSELWEHLDKLDPVPPKLTVYRADAV